MIVRPRPDATPEERAAVASFLSAHGVRVSETDGGFVVPEGLDAPAAFELAALPGVAAIEPEAPGVPTVGDAIAVWIAGAAAVLGVLVLLAATAPAPLGLPADPLRTPAVMRPSWPLLAWYSAVDRAPAWLPVSALFVTASALLFVWPLVARRFAERHPRVHTVLGLGVLALAAWLARSELSR